MLRIAFEMQLRQTQQPKRKYESAILQVLQMQEDDVE